jgi:hypothetical protein
MNARKIFERPMPPFRIYVKKIGSGFFKGILEFEHKQEVVLGRNEEELITRLKRRAALLRVPLEEVERALGFLGSGTP